MMNENKIQAARKSAKNPSTNRNIACVQQAVKNHLTIPIISAFISSHTLIGDKQIFMIIVKRQYHVENIETNQLNSQNLTIFLVQFIEYKMDQCGPRTSR